MVNVSFYSQVNNYINKNLSYGLKKEGAIPLFFYFFNRQKACQYNK